MMDEKLKEALKLITQMTPNSGRTLTHQGMIEVIDACYKVAGDALAEAHRHTAVVSREAKQVGWCWVEGVSTDEYTCKFQGYREDESDWFVQHRWAPMYIDSLPAHRAISTGEEDVDEWVMTADQAVDRMASAFAHLEHQPGLIDMHAAAHVIVDELREQVALVLASRPPVQAPVAVVPMSTPWYEGLTLRLLFPTQDDPFNRFDLEIVDIGHSEKILMVESSELHAHLLTLQPVVPDVEELEVHRLEVPRFEDDDDETVVREFVRKDELLALLQRQGGQK